MKTIAELRNLRGLGTIRDVLSGIFDHIEALQSLVQHTTGHSSEAHAPVKLEPTTLEKAAAYLQAAADSRTDARTIPGIMADFSDAQTADLRKANDLWHKESIALKARIATLEEENAALRKAEKPLWTPNQQFRRTIAGYEGFTWFTEGRCISHAFRGLKGLCSGVYPTIAAFEAAIRSGELVPVERISADADTNAQSVAYNVEYLDNCGIPGKVVTLRRFV